MPWLRWTTDAEGSTSSRESRRSANSRGLEPEARAARPARMAEIVAAATRRMMSGEPPRNRLRSLGRLRELAWIELPVWDEHDRCLSRACR